MRWLNPKARAQARRADEALLRSEPLGLLHGLPITVKEAFAVAGMRATGGTQERKAFVADQDATAVARLRAAGAIILGTTNTSELSMSFESDNLVYGRTSNHRIVGQLFVFRILLEAPASLVSAL
jgi:amidase